MNSDGEAPDYNKIPTFQSMSVFKYFQTTLAFDWRLLETYL